MSLSTLPVFGAGARAARGPARSRPETLFPLPGAASGRDWTRPVAQRLHLALGPLAQDDHAQHLVLGHIGVL